MIDHVAIAKSFNRFCAKRFGTLESATINPLYDLIIEWEEFKLTEPKEGMERGVDIKRYINREGNGIGARRISGFAEDYMGPVDWVEFNWSTGKVRVKYKEIHSHPDPKYKGVLYSEWGEHWCDRAEEIKKWIEQGAWVEVPWGMYQFELVEEV